MLLYILYKNNRITMNLLFKLLWNIFIALPVNTVIVMLILIIQLTLVVLNIILLFVGAITLSVYRLFNIPTNYRKIESMKSRYEDIIGAIFDFLFIKCLLKFKNLK